MEKVYTGDIAGCPALNRKNYVPRGGTPLYDAVGLTIVSTGEYLKSKGDAERPEKVIFVIITDGHENASREYQLAGVKEMIQHQTDLYKWQFVFLGAEFNTYDVGRAMGVSPDNVMRYAASGQGVNSMSASLGQNTRKYRAGGASTMSFSAEQKAEQEDAGAQQGS